MYKKVAIAGTGKMAESIGLFFLGKGIDIHFVTSSNSRVDEFSVSFNKKYKRLLKVAGEECIGNYSAGIITSLDENGYDFIIESTVEDLETKKRKVLEIKSIYPDAKCFSNSSSIEPELIDKKLIGMHFFYPVELTGVVEIINDKNGSGKEVAKKLALSFIVENGKRNFAVNRLLLPLQATAIKLLKEGYSSENINSISTSDLIITGQLSMIDSIGVDTVLNSVKNYLVFMDEKEKGSYSTLVDGLEDLVENKILGIKNKATVMENSDLPWKQIKKEIQPNISFELVLLNSCLNFVNQKILTFDELDMIFTNIFMADVSLRDELKKTDFQKSIEILNSLYEREGLFYFKPSPLWKEGLEICD